MLLSVRLGLGPQTETSVPRDGLKTVVPVVVSVITKMTSVLGTMQRQHVSLGADICPPHQILQD